jgi:hypothetical protein
MVVSIFGGSGYPVSRLYSRGHHRAPHVAWREVGKCEISGISRVFSVELDGYVKNFTK